MAERVNGFETVIYGRGVVSFMLAHRGAFVKVVSATSAAIVLHNLVIVQTTSPILDDGFALAVRAMHRPMRECSENGSRLG